MIKAIMLAALAACGVQPTPATNADPPAEQPDVPPESEIKPLDQHFCCQSVDHKSLSGDGCVTIGPNQIDACQRSALLRGQLDEVQGHRALRVSGRVATCASPLTRER